MGLQRRNSIGNNSGSGVESRSSHVRDDETARQDANSSAVMSGHTASPIIRDEKRLIWQESHPPRVDQTWRYIVGHVRKVRCEIGLSVANRLCCGVSRTKQKSK